MPWKAKKRPRAVVDTSVLVAGIAGFRKPFIPGKNPSADVLHRWTERQNFEWLLADDILDEYKDVLSRCGARPQVIGRVINLIREEAKWLDIRTPVEFSPDPKDNPFCACAEAGKADFIVTLNPKDFPQKRLNAKVVSPGQFLK
ncbi:MAG: PIN domain-containing protein [Acidobacteriia bacterium]|nr:PIN domain-containing protein [Terriglobia bacterium]